MNKLAAMKAAVTSKTARQVLLAQKNSPKILFVAGTVGVVTATVLACRATLKMHDVLDEHEKALVDIKLRSEPELPVTREKRDAVQKEFRNLQLNTAVQIAKLYAPAVGVGVVSIAALTGSHVVLTKRNGAVMAAYAGLDRAYKEYRQRVTNEYGADVDRKFALGSEDIVVEEKTSEGTIKKTVVQGKSNGGGSPYAALFDETNKNWSREPGANAMLIQMRQSWANDKLRAQGHLFLNEAYDLVGLPRTKAGAIVGWVYNNDPNHEGDNYVSFGVFDGDPETADDFINGFEKSIWLDFNVDGVIYDKI